MANTGQKFPTVGTGVSEAPWSDDAWVSPGNVVADDGTTASVTAATFDSGDQTTVLKATGFDFSSIPDGSTINGVIVRVNAWYRSGQGAGSLDLCQLLDASGAKVGTNQCATPVALTTTNTTIITKGSTSDLWGNALTAAWVKDPDFGVALGCLSTAANSDVDIDYVTIEIEYTPPLTATPSDSVTVTDGTPVKAFALSGAEEAIELSDNCNPELTAGGDSETATPSDTVTPSDALALDQGKTIADTATPSDDRAFDQGKVIADTATPSDALAIDRAINLADSVTPSDGTPAVAFALMGAEDSLAVTDFCDPVKTAGGGDSETANIDDSVTPSDALSFDRALVQPDTVSLADAMSFDRANLIEDLAGLSDNATTSVAFVLAIDDTVGLADDSTAARGFVIEDSVSLSDGVETIDGNFLAIDDPVGLSDSLESLATFERAVNDSVTPSDGTPSVGYAFTGAESTLPLSDNVTPLEGGGGNDWTATPSDSVTPSDALVFDRVLSISDSVTPSDAVVTQEGVFIDDSVSLSDEITPIATLGREVNDSVTPSDALAIDRSMVLEDAVSLSDALGRSLVTPSDTVTPTDGTASVGTFLTGAESSITLSDNVTPELGAGGTDYTRNVDDTVSIADSGAMFNYAVSIAETDFNLSDNITPVKTPGGPTDWTVNVDDSVSVSDGRNIVLGLNRSVGDSVTPSDGLATQAGLNRTVNDSVTPSDGLVFDATFSINDFLTVSDAISPQKILAIGIDDTLGLADAVSTARDVQIGVSDPVSLADALSRGFGLNLVDLVTPISDNVSYGGIFNYQLTLSDTIGTSSGFGEQPITIGRF